MSAPIGQLDVLNCGRGHLQIKFDKRDEDDRDKARRVIRDMLKRGYLLFVEIDGEQHRVKEFDAERDEYILKDPVDVDGNEKIAETSVEFKDEQSWAKTAAGGEDQTKKSHPPLKEITRRRAKMQHHRATAIAPTAGG